MVDALSLIHPTDKWYIYNFHIPNFSKSGGNTYLVLERKPRDA
jgi:hypothetical protein